VSQEQTKLRKLKFISESSAFPSPVYKPRTLKYTEFSFMSMKLGSSIKRKNMDSVCFKVLRRMRIFETKGQEATGMEIITQN
jgi:hypothetical protein